jgi:hypothetical protein
MAVEVAIIVSDVQPLITLAAVQSLDYLLYPAMPLGPGALNHPLFHNGSNDPNAPLEYAHISFRDRRLLPRSVMARLVRATYSSTSAAIGGPDTPGQDGSERFRMAANTLNL